MMEPLIKGQRLALASLAPGGKVQIGLRSAGPALDFACFGLSAAGKLRSDDYMIFFNQPRSPCGGIALHGASSDLAGFSFELNRLPADIERVVVTASVDGDGSMGQLQAGHLRLLDGDKELARYAFSGTEFAAERALMLGEFYRRDGQWRFMVVGQGFNGGLDALVTHFGAALSEQVGAGKPAASTPAVTDSRAALDKRVEKQAPQLVSLVKQARVSLEKVGMDKHRARVCLCLDISGSMGQLYRKGLVQAFAERILALGCQFDDDGQIDVFLFGEKVHQPGAMGLANSRDYVQQAIVRHPLEGDTRYGRAMEAIRAFYFPDAKGGARTTALKQALPVYVMFVTDGTTSDKGATEKQLRWSSMEPIFWQFMGIGKGKKSKSKLDHPFAESDFPFLDKLDELPGRLIDNANFFSVAAPDEHPDNLLYDLLMTEYPGWIKLARQHGLLA